MTCPCCSWQVPIGSLEAYALKTVHSSGAADRQHAGMHCCMMQLQEAVHAHLLMFKLRRRLA